MEKNEPYIGITGITCVDDVEIIKNALGNSYGMYGVLVSRDTLKNGKPHRNRYPNIGSINKLFWAMPENALRAVHYNSEVKHEISKYVKEIMSLTGGLCNCVQLNIEYPPIYQVREIKEENKDLKIIFQIGRDSLLNMKTRYIVKNMEPYVPYIDYILIDKSQGAGIQMEIIGIVELANPLSKLKSLTFAGGLDGSNICVFITLIENFCAGIDAEGKLMDDNDTLDHEKVAKYIRSAKLAKGEIELLTKEEMFTHLPDINANIRFSREDIITKFFYKTKIDERDIDLVLTGRADQVSRENGYLTVYEDKFPRNPLDYAKRNAPFSSQILQALIYLNSKFKKKDCTITLDDMWECQDIKKLAEINKSFEIPHKYKKWVVNIRNKNAEVENNIVKKFEGIQTDQDRIYLEGNLYRFVGLILGKKEKVHHHSSRKCKPCEYSSICRFSLI